MIEQYENARHIVDDRFESYRETLFDLLRYPSVSATGNTMDECADRLCGILTDHGFDSPTRIETDRYDLVYGERLVGDDRPTVLFYGHYDVQPAENRSEWHSDPFEPTVRDGAIYARGAGDNKGQLLAHVFGLDVATTVSPEPSMNVKVLFEGGEESGSVGLQSYLDRDPPRLRDVDLVYVSDGPMHSSGDPTIIYGNRGLLAFRIDCRTARTDLHSGNYGGPIPNAATNLTRIVASLYDSTPTNGADGVITNAERQDGRTTHVVAVEGFYEAVNVTDRAIELAREVPHDPDRIEAETGLDTGEIPEYYVDLLLNPSLSVNGIHAGHDGEGIKTVIPHRATATLDARLVPDQDPQHVYELIERHVRQHPIDAEVTKLGELPPMQTASDGSFAEDIRRALAESWERPPVEMPLMGGSLPSAYLQDALDVPVFVVPYANPDQGNHSPNEHLTIECFRRGIQTSATFLIDTESR